MVFGGSNIHFLFLSMSWSGFYKQLNILIDNHIRDNAINVFKSCFGFNLNSYHRMKSFCTNLRDLEVSCQKSESP